MHFSTSSLISSITASCISVHIFVIVIVCIVYHIISSLVIPSSSTVECEVLRSLYFKNNLSGLLIIIIIIIIININNYRLIQYKIVHYYTLCVYSLYYLLLQGLGEGLQLLHVRN